MGHGTFILYVFAMLLTRKLNLDNPGALYMVRTVYLGGQALMLMVFVGFLIISWCKNDQTVLKYTRTGPRLRPLIPEDLPCDYCTISVVHHDMCQASELIYGVFSGMFIIAILHLYFRLNVVLFVQIILTPKHIYDTHLFALHILGRPATGELVRPFLKNGLVAWSTTYIVEKRVQKEE